MCLMFLLVPSLIFKSECSISRVFKTNCIRVQIQQFIRGLYEFNKDQVQFKNHVRDFLIQLKEFQGDELFVEDREAEMAQKKQEEFQAALLIPGLVKPHDRPDDMMD